MANSLTPGVTITHRARRIFRAVAALVCTASPVAGEYSSEPAREFLESGRPGEAIAMYREWDAAFPDDPELPVSILEVIPLVEDLALRQELLVLAVASGGVHGAAETSVTLHGLLVALAETEELRGDLASARRHYRDASFALPGKKDFVSLLRAASLAFEVGDYLDSEAQARVIVETARDPGLVLRAKVLLSRVYYATDRLERSYALLMDGTEMPDDLDAAALFWLHRLAVRTGNDDVAVAAAGHIEARFPESLEASIVAGTIKRLPAASAILEAPVATGVGAIRDTGGAPETSTSPAETEETPVSIQTGSFTVRENAVYAAEDLSDSGFVAVVRERVVSGVTYYRVLVPDVARAQVSRTILELKEAGFEGFPVFD